MAEASKTRNQFKQIKDSIMVNKARYKLLGGSKEGSTDSEPPLSPPSNGSPGPFSYGAALKPEKCPALDKAQPDAGAAVRSKKTSSSDKVKGTDKVKAMMRKAMTQGSISSGDECLTLDEDEDEEEGRIKQKVKKKKKGDSGRKSSQSSSKDEESGKKGNSKKGVGMKGVGSMMCSIATLAGSVVTQDRTMLAHRDTITTLEGLDDKESSDTGTPDDVAGAGNNNPAKKISMTARLAAMVTKDKPKALVSKDSEVNMYKMCPILDHDQFLSLYCKNRKCQKPICALCLLEEHKGHSVRDLKQTENETTENLLNLVESTTCTYSSVQDRLNTARKTINISTRNAVEALEAKREAVTKMFDKLRQEILDSRTEVVHDIDRKLAALEENAAQVASIGEEAGHEEADSTSQNDIAAGMKIVREIKEQTDKLLKQSRVCTHYEYKDSGITLEELNQICGGLARVETNLDLQPAPEKPKIKLDKVVKSFRTQYEDINGITVLSDGHIVVFGTDFADWQYRLTVYTTEVQIANTTLLKDEPWGMAEVTLSNTPTLAVSYPDAGKILFHDLRNLANVVAAFRVAPAQPRCMCAIDAHTLLYEDNSTNPLEIRWLDCKRHTPKILKMGDNTIQTHQSWTSDMCCALAPGNKKLLVTTHYSKGVYAYNTASGKVEWKISGRLEPAFKEDIRPWGVTTDGVNGLFICDLNNDCVLLVSAEGGHLGAVFRAGQGGLGAPWRIGWSRPARALVVQDSRDEESCINLVKVKKII